jgi:hypothetical protein
MSCWAAGRDPGRWLLQLWRGRVFPRHLDTLLGRLRRRRFLPSNKRRRELLGSRTGVWRHRLFALLLWVHMHGGSKRFVLPTGDRGKRQQGTLIVGAATCG